MHIMHIISPSLEIDCPQSSLSSLGKLLIAYHDCLLISHPVLAYLILRGVDFPALYSAKKLISFTESGSRSNILSSQTSL